MCPTVYVRQTLQHGTGTTQQGQPLLSRDSYCSLVKGVVECREVLVMVMRKHQRYFPLYKPASQHLLPHFITVANGPIDVPTVKVGCPSFCPCLCPVLCPLLCPVLCPLLCPLLCPPLCPLLCPSLCSLLCPSLCPMRCSLAIPFSPPFSSALRAALCCAFPGGPLLCLPAVPLS